MADSVTTSRRTPARQSSVQSRMVDVVKSRSMSRESASPLPAPMQAARPISTVRPLQLLPKRKRHTHGATRPNEQQQSERTNNNQMQLERQFYTFDVKTTVPFAGEFAYFTGSVTIPWPVNTQQRSTEITGSHTYTDAQPQLPGSTFTPIGSTSLGGNNILPPQFSAQLANSFAAHLAANLGSAIGGALASEASNDRHAEQVEQSGRANAVVSMQASTSHCVDQPSTSAELDQIKNKNVIFDSDDNQLLSDVKQQLNIHRKKKKRKRAKEEKIETIEQENREKKLKENVEHINEPVKLKINKALITPPDAQPKVKKRRKDKEEKSEKPTTSMCQIPPSNWKAIGESIEKLVILNNTSRPAKRLCFDHIQYKKDENEKIAAGQCILVCADTKENFIAKILTFFHCPTTDRLMMNVMWYYRPEKTFYRTRDAKARYAKQAHQEENTTAQQCSARSFSRSLSVSSLIGEDPQTNEHTSKFHQYINYRVTPGELFASKHIDCVPCDAIQDVCYVLTQNEWARYHAENAQELLVPGIIDADFIERGIDEYPRRKLQPCVDAQLENVFFCRRVIDWKSGLLSRNLDSQRM